MAKKRSATPGSFKPGNEYEFKKDGPNPGWKPGQSGNPGGRPKIDKEIRELAQTYSIQAVETLAAIMLNHDYDPRVRGFAANSILDRAVGKPAQAVVHSGTIDTARASTEELLQQFTPEQRAMLSMMDPRIAALAGTLTSH